MKRLLGIFDRDFRHAVRVRPHPGSPVVVHIMGEHSLDFVTARDISESGIGVHVPHGFDAHDLENEVSLIVSMPGHRPFKARGNIRHVNQADSFFGLAFTQIDQRCRNQIRRYIAELISAGASQEDR